MKIKYIDIILSLLFLTVSCNSINKKNIEDYITKDLTLLDGYKNNYKKDSLKYKKPRSFYPIYSGEVKDTIHLLYDRFSPEIKTLKYNEQTNTVSPSKENLIIFIDTTKFIASNEFVTYGIDDDYNNLDLNNQAFPVFLVNIGNDTLKLSEKSYTLHMNIEILNSNNIWLNQSKHSGIPMLCSTKTPIYFIAPNQVVITTINNFEGTTKSKLRVTYVSETDTIYSNSINTLHTIQ